MSSSRDTMEHLFSCFDTTYSVLGESAPTLTNDAYVVRTYDMARAMGEVAMSFREYLEEVTIPPLSALEDVLRRAVASDDSGAMVLFAMAMVIGPRVLVSLVDARAEGGLDESALEVLDLASGVLVREIRAVGDVAARFAPIEDPIWQERARSLSTTLDSSGNAESFGISR
jgi:hypothetical protein